MSEGRSGARGARLQWPAHPPVRLGAEPVHLLEEDEDLAAELDPGCQAEACRRVLARSARAEEGELVREKWLEMVGRGPGLLVLEGVLACETRVAGRTASELIGAGDLLQARPPRGEDFLHQGEEWRVLAAARVALLDDEFLVRSRPWPQVASALLRRAGRRYVELDALRAIVSHPRLEERLVLLLWHLAARWGRVEPAGIRLRLPLTHRLLGQIVAAERPSVSHALTRLAEAGLVEGCTADLHLRGRLEEHLQVLDDRQPRIPERYRDQERSVSVISAASTPAPRASAAV